MRTDITIVKNIRDDAGLRSSFNRLAEKTFELNFENWYQNGYWKDNYIPYAAVREGQVVANVSVNPMAFSENGVTRHYIQLGTVMTDPAFRGQGLCRLLMEAVEKDWADRVEAIYLFSNDTVLDFYPRFGFRRVPESRFFAPLSACMPLSACAPEAFASVSKSPDTTPVPGTVPDKPAVLVPITDPANRAALERAILSGVPQGSFDMAGNPGLILFYASQFLTENVWYLPACGAWVIAEEEGDTLLLDAIFAPHPVDPKEAAAALLAGPFRDRFRNAPDDRSRNAPGSLFWLECGFTPFFPTDAKHHNPSGNEPSFLIKTPASRPADEEAADGCPGNSLRKNPCEVLQESSRKNSWEIRPLTNDDDALFVKGTLSEAFFGGKMRFPVLSHA